MQPRIPVQVLPLEPQVLFGGRFGPLIQRIDCLSCRAPDFPLFRNSRSPRLVAGLPAQLALAVGQFFGQADLIRVEVEDLANAMVAVRDVQGFDLVTRLQRLPISATSVVCRIAIVLIAGSRRGMGAGSTWGL